MVPLRRSRLAGLIVRRIAARPPSADGGRTPHAHHPRRSGGAAAGIPTRSLLREEHHGHSRHRDKGVVDLVTTAHRRPALTGSSLAHRTPTGSARLGRSRHRRHQDGCRRRRPRGNHRRASRWTSPSSSKRAPRHRPSSAHSASASESSSYRPARTPQHSVPRSSARHRPRAFQPSAGRPTQDRPPRFAVTRRRTAPSRRTGAARRR